MSTKIQKKLNRIMHPIIMEIELKKKAKENSRNCKQNETCYQLSSSQHLNMNSSIDNNIDKLMEKKFKREYSFISFNNDKILSEINELKNSFMLPSTTTSSVVSNGIYHKPHPQNHNNNTLYNNNNKMNISYNKTFIPKQRPYKTLFKLYDKPNKAKLFFSQRQHNQNGINNNYNQETSLVTPFNHNNDLEYVTFMKEMSEYKDQKIAEWKDVYLDY